LTVASRRTGGTTQARYAAPMHQYATQAAHSTLCAWWTAGGAVVLHLIAPIRGETGRDEHDGEGDCDKGHAWGQRGITTNPGGRQLRLTRRRRLQKPFDDDGAQPGHATGRTSFKTRKNCRFRSTKCQGCQRELDLIQRHGMGLDGATGGMQGRPRTGPVSLRNLCRRQTR